MHRKGFDFVSSSAKDLLETGLVRRDPVDGVFFIDAYKYRIGRCHPNYPAEGRTFNRTQLECIRDNITYEHDAAVDVPKVYKKLEWLRDRWDEQFPRGSGGEHYRTPHGRGLDLSERERTTNAIDLSFLDPAP